MADPRFFQRHGPFTLGELCRIAGATLSPGSDPGMSLSDVAPLHEAGAAHLSFLDNPRYLSAFATSRAGACLAHPDMADKAPAGMALLLTLKPYRSYALCAAAFYPNLAGSAGVSPAAHVDATAEIGTEVEVGAGAVIEAGARIGARCRIGPNAVIGRNVELGEDCVIGACASLSHCLLGSRVVVFPGARIGQDGFGFAMDAEGHLRVPQLGRVIIEDDVEVGANTTIDRGAGPDTVIGRGTRIDNLVQIAHNVVIGPGCVIVAQAGIAGSTHLGHHVALAAQAGIAGHLKIGAGARIAAQSGLMRDVEPGSEVGGTPAMPLKTWLRQTAWLAKAMRTRISTGQKRQHLRG